MDDIQGIAGRFWDVMKDDTLPDSVMPRAFSTIVNWQTFEWKTGYTPFSHPSWPVGAIIAYVISLYVMTQWMKGRERFKLVLVTRYHNLLLCLWSLVMCLGASYVIFDAVVNKGYTFIDLVCDTKYGKAALMSGPLGFWAWSYYVSKFYELFDTILQILKKKPLTVLHVYHHICMVLTTWIWCSDKLTMHWYAIIVNCCVHVFMYYYYYRASFMRYRPWWRSLITKGQIVQFIFGAVTAITWIVHSLENPRLVASWPFIDHDGSKCTGTPGVVAWSQVLTYTLLALFVNFYVQVYIAGRDRKLAAQAEAEAEAEQQASGGKKGGKKRSTTPAKSHAE